LKKELLLLTNINSKAFSCFKRGLFLVLQFVFFNISIVFAHGITPSNVLSKMFVSVSANMFGKEYEKLKSLQVDGNVSVTAPVSSLSRKLKNINESASFSVGVSGTFLPNGERKLELSGDLGEVVLSLRNGKDIIYSEDFNAYSLNKKGISSRLNNFRSFFNTKLNEIKNDMLTSGRWSLSINKGVVYGSEDCYKVTASTYIKEEERRLARSKSQNFDDLITFWKRGTVVFFIRKKDFMPLKIEYTNPIENIQSELVFSYSNNLPLTISVSGNAANIYGSGDLNLSYNEKGVLQSVSLDFSNQLNQSFDFSFSFVFSQNVNREEIAFIPPFGSNKMGKENLKLLILTNVAGTLLRMQQAGIKIKTLKF
jgi:hypothetical protein